MYWSQLFDHLQGSSFVLSAITTFSACLRRLFGMWLCVVYVCACLIYLSVGCLVVNCSQPNIPQTSTSSTHTHINNIQPHTK